MPHVAIQSLAESEMGIQVTGSASRGLSTSSSGNVGSPRVISNSMNSGNRRARVTKLMYVAKLAIETH